MRQKNFQIILILNLLLGVCLSCKTDLQESSSLSYYYNGNIYSMDEASGHFSAMIVEDGRILALGGDQIRDMISDQEYQSINLDGRYVFPGLIEGHGHFMSLGEVVCGLDISGLESWEKVLEKTREYAANQSDQDGWLVGKGWHPNHWASLPTDLTEGYPDNQELSGLFPDRPVILQHSSFHALMANQKALEHAGITRETPDPPGGRIVRDDTGNPTGMLEENAMSLVMDPYFTWKEGRPIEVREEEMERYLDSATQECLSYGITTFVDAGVDVADYQIYERYHRERGLDIRVWAMTAGRDLLDGSFDKIVPYQSSDDRLFVQGTKAYIDGALGANGAWMVDQYADQPGWHGQNVTDLSTLKAIGQKCIDLGLQYCVHAIGDRANREVLNLYEDLFEENKLNGRPLRWRIEHAQIIQPDDISRFSQLGVIPAMQAIHCTSDAPMVVPKIGEQLAREGGYAWRSLIDNGSIIANGTDTPVESVDPFENLYASVTRRSGPGEPPFYPAQSMTRREALKSLTIWNAYACQLEDYTGSLETGKWADFFITDTDLMKCDVNDILNAEVLQTYLNGELVWERKSP